MSDFENDVRDALSAIETQPPLDPDAVVKRGKKIRIRRRAIVGLAAVGAVAVIGAVAVVPKLGTSTVASADPSESPSAAPRSYVCPAGGVERKPEPGAVPLKEISVTHLGPATPDGDAICTGAFDSKGEAVIYFQNGTDVPGKPSTIWEGRRDATGKYSGYFRGRDYSFAAGSADLKPGFHTMTGDGFDNFIFGLYTGPVANVEFIAQGKKMETHLQKWSKNPAVTIFWFRIPKGVEANRVYDSIYRKPGDVKISAYDANGKSAPLGDITILAE